MTTIDHGMHFDFQPTLKGHRLELRPLRLDDFSALFAVASDPLLWEQHPDRYRYQEAVFRRFFEDALASGGALVACDRIHGGRIIGSSRYANHDPARSEVEIGWSFLARSHWGGSYNGEMKRLMIDHAFQFVEHIVFHVGPQNLRSRRAIEKVGGVLLGTCWMRGHEAVRYGITRGGETILRGDAPATTDKPV